MSKQGQRSATNPIVKADKAGHFERFKTRSDASAAESRASSSLSLANCSAASFSSADSFSRRAFAEPLQNPSTGVAEFFSE
jgi:hypothetical protein